MLSRWFRLFRRGVPVIVPEGVRPRFLMRVGYCEPVEVPLSDQILDLVFKVDTLFSGMVVVMMETAVLGLVLAGGRGF